MTRLDELRTRLAKLSPQEATDLLYKLLNPVWCGAETCDQTDKVSCPACPHFRPDVTEDKHDDPK